MACSQGIRAGRMLKFESEAVAYRTFLVTAAEGRESISEPWRFTLDLVCDSKNQDDLDLRSILQSDASFTIKYRPSGLAFFLSHAWRGVLASLEVTGQDPHWTHYRAVLVPKIWRLSLRSRSRVFTHLSVPQIVHHILKSDYHMMGVDPDRPAVVREAEDWEYEFPAGMGAQYPKREFVVQHQESDLNFIQRLLEHEGIFYFFKELGDAERIVFSDRNEDFPFHHVPEEVPFLVGGYAPEHHGVRRLKLRHTVVPSKVVLKDYNYRTPDVDLTESAAGGGTCFGEVYQYGEHQKDPEEGKRLAQVRAQEVRAHEIEFTGESDCRSFGAGRLFTLVDHPRRDFNGTRLIRAVTHVAEQRLGIEGEVEPGSVGYHNEFTSQPAQLPFRPERLTPKPRIAGVVTARVEAAGGTPYAEIDEQGRYRIRMTWDRAETAPATASHYVRKAEPYSGPNYGQHFPLHAGAEVVLSYVNGDVDRPIIVGAVPNPSNATPVAAQNQTQCVLRSGGQNELVLEDSEKSKYIWLSSPGHSELPHSTYLNLGASHPCPIPVPDGVTLGTEKGVSINAGEGINISAGTSDHRAAIESSSKILAGVLTAAGVMLPVTAAAGNLAKGGGIKVLSTIGGMADELLSYFLGNVSPSAYITAPGRTALASMTDSIVAGGLAASVIGGASANLMSPGLALVTGVMGVSIVSARNVELQSNWANVEVKAKKEVHITAQKQNVEVSAQEKDVVIEAKQAVQLTAFEGPMTIVANQGMHVESLTKHQIVLKAGRSSLVMTDEGITLKADKIYLVSPKKGAEKEELASIMVTNDGVVPVAIETTGRAEIRADEALHCHTEGMLDLFADRSIIMSTPLLSQKKVKEIQRAESKERSPDQWKRPAAAPRRAPPPPVHAKETMDERGEPGSAPVVPAKQGQIDTDIIPGRGKENLPSAREVIDAALSSDDSVSGILADLHNTGNGSNS